MSSEGASVTSAAAQHQQHQSSSESQPGRTQSNDDEHLNGSCPNNNSQEQPHSSGNSRSSEATAAHFAPRSQGSREPNRVEDRPVFGVNYQIEGQPAWPTPVLHPSFRAAGPKNPMIGNFVKAIDKMAEGKH